MNIFIFLKQVTLTVLKTTRLIQMLLKTFKNQSSFLNTGKTFAVLMVSVATLSFSAQAQPINIEDLPPQPVQSAVPDDVMSPEEIDNVFADDIEVESFSIEPEIQNVEIQEVEVVEFEPELQNEVVLSPPPAAAESKSAAMPVEVIKVTNSPSTPEPIANLEPLAPEPDPVETAYQEPEPQQVPYSGTYYDSDSIGPSSLGASAGPRKVDPLYEPGSTFVTVTKNASSSSRQSQIVAAQRALKLERYSSALEIYEKLYKKNKRNTQVLMGLAVAQQYNGFNESAIATYEELLKIAPRHSGATVNLMGLLTQRRPSDAYKKLQKLWSKDTHNPAVAAQLGLVSASLGDNEGALRYLGIASSLEPRNAMHHYNVAVVLDRASSHREAIKSYQKALEVDASNQGGRNISREEVYDRLAQLRRL